MSIFATQLITVPPPSYSRTRHQPLSCSPSSPSSISTTSPGSLPSIRKNESRSSHSWFTLMLSSISPFPSQDQGFQQCQQRSCEASDSTPIYKVSSPPSPFQPPPQYTPTSSIISPDVSSPSLLTISSRSLSIPKPNSTISDIETEFLNEDQQLHVQDEGEEEKRREEGEGSGDWCCNWYWVAPPNASSLPWEGWYIF